MAALGRFAEAFDRLHEAAAVAGGDLRVAFEQAHHGVRFRRLVGDQPAHLLGAVVAGHGQRDLPDVGAGTDAAAGGRERSNERDRDRRAAAHAHGIGQAPLASHMTTVSLFDGMSLPRRAGSAVASLRVTVACPAESVGPDAPLTVAPAAGFFLPLSS